MHKSFDNPVSCGCRVHRMHLCKTLPPKDFLVKTLDNLIVQLQFSSFEECGVSLHWHKLRQPSISVRPLHPKIAIAPWSSLIRNGSNK